MKEQNIDESLKAKVAMRVACGNEFVDSIREFPHIMDMWDKDKQTFPDFFLFLISFKYTEETLLEHIYGLFTKKGPDFWL